MGHSHISTLIDVCWDNEPSSMNFCPIFRPSVGRPRFISHAKVNNVPNNDPFYNPCEKSRIMSHFPNRECLQQFPGIAKKSLLMRYFSISILTSAVLSGIAFADVKLDENAAVVFATVDEGVKILAARDDFIRRLSPFDRSCILKTDKDVSEQEFLDHVSKSVLEWDESEKAAISDAISDIYPRMKELALPWPKTVFFIKTTGEEEGGAAYTRANAVVFPKSMLATLRRNSLQRNALHRIIYHELFHVLSRNNPELREKLYGAVGFVKCEEIEFPVEYAGRKITNPDAPTNDYCIKLKIDGAAVWAMPILFSKSEKYDVAKGGMFLNYMTCKFLVVSNNNSPNPGKIDYDKAKPRIVDMKDVSDFYEQVGKNTHYVIHPEEILADNFAIIILEDKNIPSPKIADRIKTILNESSLSRPVAP
jgi:hypothetical protein